MVISAGCGPEHEGECRHLVHEGTLEIGSLEDTVDLPLYTEITGSLSIGNAPGLKDLSFFHCLDTVGSTEPVDDLHSNVIDISRAVDLETLNGLERLEHVDNLKVIKIEDNPKLRSLEALESLRAMRVEFGGIWITGNPSLRVLGLRNLEEVPEMQVGDRKAGEPLAEPDAEWPPGASTCLPAGMDGLEEIDGLDSLTRFNRLSFLGNVNLVSIEGLRGLAQRAEALSPDDDPYAPGVWFGLNTNLPLSTIRQLWADDMGAIQLTTCGNRDEEVPCEPCY